jgi:hypothetical protein
LVAAALLRIAFACIIHLIGAQVKETGWYKDLNERPSERDLLKAEIFMEEIIEEYYQ